MEIWYLLITEKFLFWSFREWKIRSFFKSKSWWKDDIYWSLRSSCSELFGDGKYELFLSQKVDGKMIYTWSFSAFHDIPGLGKYGFSSSEYVWLFSGHQALTGEVNFLKPISLMFALHGGYLTICNNSYWTEFSTLSIDVFRAPCQTSKMELLQKKFTARSH